MINVSDLSIQITPELLYSGVKNLDLRLRVYALRGGAGTDFGEQQNSRKIEMYAWNYL
jgi:hypothetical protein